MDRLQRERAHTLAARLREQYQSDIEAVHSRYRELQRDRLRSRDFAFDRLREERQELLAAQPRDTQRLAAVEQQMRSLRRDPEPIDVSDLHEQRDEELRELGRRLDADLETLRKRAQEGTITEEECTGLTRWDARGRPACSLPSGCRRANCLRAGYCIGEVDEPVNVAGAILVNAGGEITPAA